MTKLVTMLGIVRPQLMLPFALEFFWDEMVLGMY